MDPFSRHILGNFRFPAFKPQSVKPVVKAEPKPKPKKGEKRKFPVISRPVKL